MKDSIPFLIIAVCIGMYFLYLSPSVAEVKALSLKKDEYASVLSRTQDLVKKRDEIQAQYDSIPAEDLAKLDKMIPDEFNSEMFANDINNIAAKYGILVQGVRTATVETQTRQEALSTVSTEGFKTYNATVTLKGQYLQFVKFLASLESSLRLHDVKSLSIRYSKDEKFIIDNSEFAVEINVYALR